MLRTNDSAIMDAVSTSDFTTTKQENFNIARLQMRFHSIVEITTAEGSKITARPQKGKRQQHTATLWLIQS